MTCICKKGSTLIGLDDGAIHAPGQCQAPWSDCIPISAGRQRGEVKYKTSQKLSGKIKDSYSQRELG